MPTYTLGVVAATQAAGTRAKRFRGGIQNPYSRLPDWLYPTSTVVVFSLFIIYSGLVVLFETTGRFGPYLSPFFSPEVNVRLGSFLIPPALWVAWAPLTFRVTCYYYRKAYFRSFLLHPRSCAATDPEKRDYRGETRLWVFNNLHRFAFYATALQTLILIYDAVIAFSYHGAFHFGLGNVIMLFNVACLLGYTYGCHAWRHLVGGSTDCFSCHRARFRLWQGVTVLNANHAMWAWVSMFTVWFTDIYIRLGVHGLLGQAAWL